MVNSQLRAGIVGAGYISDYHLAAINRQKNVSLVAICDLNEQAAKSVASRQTGVTVYTDLSAMLAEARLDVVHVLTQPDSHHALAKMALDAGCHVVLEKPAAISLAATEDLAALAKKKGVSVATNHNFVFSRPFNALKEIVDDGALGPIKSVRIIWKKILPQLHSGPWNVWMLREPANILFETGPHVLSELLGVVPDAKIVSVRPSMPKRLPTGSVFWRRWNISATAGPISIQVDLSLDQGYEQHSVEVEGLFGVAVADIENDVFIINQPTGRAYDAERFHLNFGAGLSRMRQSFSTYWGYAASKLSTSATGNPYETSMFNGISNCYKEIFCKEVRRQESGIEFSVKIAKLIEEIQQKMPPDAVSSGERRPELPTPVTTPGKEARVLIVGASGFIGKHLLVKLQRQGVKVRALVRNISSLVGVALEPGSEVMVGDFRDRNVIEPALEGIEVVFHLAVAHSNSLAGYIKNDVNPTKEFVRLCQSKNIKRFIYTGTIDSLYLGPNAGTIREEDGVDRRIKRRNNYAHSKAIVEAFLNKLYHEEHFPVVIIRPAIVLGLGGPIAHVGIANWFGLGRCKFWGKGENNIPVVLVNDVVKALGNAIDAPDVIGKTYNLSSPSCLSARDYVCEVERVLGCKIYSEPSCYFTYFVGDFLKWLVKVFVRHPDARRIPSVRDWRCREQYAIFDTTNAQRDLNWMPETDRDVILEKGIREPVRNYLESHIL